MSTPRSDYWTDVQTIHATTIIVEMTRFGLLWHGHAAKLLKGSQVDRNALAIAWGADKDQVYQDVLQGAAMALEHRGNHNQMPPHAAEQPGNGVFVMGCWRSFPDSTDHAG